MMTWVPMFVRRLKIALIREQYAIILEPPITRFQILLWSSYPFASLFSRKRSLMVCQTSWAVESYFKIVWRKIWESVSYINCLTMEWTQHHSLYVGFEIRAIKMFVNKYLCSCFLKTPPQIIVQFIQIKNKRDIWFNVHDATDLVIRCSRRIHGRKRGRRQELKYVQRKKMSTRRKRGCQQGGKQKDRLIWFRKVWYHVINVFSYNEKF